MLDAVHHIHGIIYLCQQFEILDTLADRHDSLASKYNAAE